MRREQAGLREMRGPAFPYVGMAGTAAVVNICVQWLKKRFLCPLDSVY